MDQTAEILLAAYNGEQYIAQQMDSILAQSSGEWHLTVSDDGSTDSTPEILDDYIGKHPDKISRTVSGRRFGNARDHFFWLIQQCSADYVFTCDQDDRWYPDKMKRTMDALIQAEKEHGKDTPILVFTDQTPTDADLKPLAASLMRYQNQYFGHFDYRSILMQNVVTGGAMCFNRALKDLAMQCREPAQTIMHDWWMAAVAARFGKIVYIDEPLSDYRQHGTNSVGAKRVGSIEYVIGMLSEPKHLRASILAKKRQAKLFADTYDALLEEEDAVFISGFVRLRSGMQFYWKNRKLVHGFFRLAGMMALG